jgi:type IV pilus assembly protein PilC
MAKFKYKALDGNQKEISGIVEAVGEDMAADTLKDKGYKILSLQESHAGSGGFNIVLDRVKTKDLVVMSRQLSVLVSANVSLVESLRILVDQTENMRLKMIISELGDNVDEGARLSDALAKHPKIFGDFYINVIRAGETSGKLDDSLNYLADELEKDYDMMSKIKGAMIYPAFVVCGMIVVGIIMMIFVVPKLTDVITQAGGELPMSTKILIGTSDFMVGYWYLLIIALVAAAVGFRFLLAVPAVRQVFDMLLLRLPIFGQLFQKIYLVRFVRSLETLIAGGVNIAKALEISGRVISNSVYQNLILETKKQVEDGESIALVFEQSTEIPPMVSQMMKIGEKTGRLDEILNKVSNFYTREINNTIANLMSLMEPIIMVVMGVGVGIMVAAIILPMYNMASVM